MLGLENEEKLLSLCQYNIVYNIRHACTCVILLLVISVYFIKCTFIYTC